jgi:hypothetical protein
MAALKPTPAAKAADAALPKPDGSEASPPGTRGTAALTGKTTPVTVTALFVIEHDGVRYEVGESLDLSAKQAQALIDVGAAKVA